MSGHEAWLALTPPMRALLERARKGRVTGWDAGSTTVGACKQAGFLRAVKVTTETGFAPGAAKHRSTRTEYELTDSGRAAIDTIPLAPSETP